MPLAPSIAATGTALGGAAASPASLRRVAQEFESGAIAAMFQPVFATLKSDGPFTGGAAEAQWRPMMVDALARDMARTGGIGIGDAVYRTLLRAQERQRA